MAAGDIKGFFRRTLLLGVELRPGELLGVLAMFTSLFLILLTAYLLKPAREMLILTEGTAEIRSYAVALQALMLLVFIPIYAKFSRRFNSSKSSAQRCSNCSCSTTFRMRLPGSVSSSSSARAFT